MALGSDFQGPVYRQQYPLKNVSISGPHQVIQDVGGEKKAGGKTFACRWEEEEGGGEAFCRARGARKQRELSRTSVILRKVRGSSRYHISSRNWALLLSVQYRCRLGNQRAFFDENEAEKTCHQFWRVFDYKCQFTLGIRLMNNIS